jgi:hypothetical protein
MKYGPVAAKAIQDQIQKDKILDASNGCTKVVSIVEYGSVPLQWPTLSLMNSLLGGLSGHGPVFQDSAAPPLPLQTYDNTNNFPL